MIWRVVKVILFLLYLAYTGYSLYRTWGTDGATRLLVLLVIVLCVTLRRRMMRSVFGALSGIHVQKDNLGRFLNIGKWLLYSLALGGAVVYLALQVIPYRPQNLVSLAGFAFLILTCLLMSSDPVKISWHTVFWGGTLQFYLAIFVLRTEVGYNLVSWIGDRVTEFISFTDSGSKFLFGEAYIMHPFVFKSCPINLYVSAVMAVCYHYGVIQAIIATLGRFLAVCLHTSPIESVNTAANIFLGLPEAPLFIRPFLDHVTESEMFAIMTGGFASISLTGLGIFISFGIPAKHLLAASLMSAPASLAVAKLMYPDSTRPTIKAKDAYNVETGASKDLLEAVSMAAVTGVTLVVYICANALVSVAFLDFFDSAVVWFGLQAGVDNLSFRRILSYIFYPFMFLCGIEVEDLLTMGRLVGVKVVANVIVAYQQAGVVIKNSHAFTEYLVQTNGTWRYAGDDIILDAWNQTLVGGVLTERSSTMVTYILCGFSHMSAFAVCLGVMTSLAPKRTAVITKLVVRAGIAGNVACFMTGCVAGNCNVEVISLFPSRGTDCPMLNMLMHCYSNFLPDFEHTKPIYVKGTCSV